MALEGGDFAAQLRSASGGYHPTHAPPLVGSLHGSPYEVSLSTAQEAMAHYRQDSSSDQRSSPPWIGGAQAANRRNPGPARRSEGSPSWLAGIQQAVEDECGAALQEVEEGRRQLAQLNKFADDDWGATADDYARIGKRLAGRKRKLGQSLNSVMRTQDETSGFEALPQLTQGEKKEFENAWRANQGGVQGGGGGGRVSADVRLDDEGVDLAIAEFDARVTSLDGIRREMGEELEADLRAREKLLQAEAEQRLVAMRSRLRWGDRFELYVFEEDEVARGIAYRRLKSAMDAVLFLVRLQNALSRKARSKQNWKKAFQVAKSVRRFGLEGMKSGLKGRLDPETGEWVPEDEDDFSLADSDSEATTPRAAKGGGGGKKPGRVKDRGWKPPEDFEEKKEHFDRAQKARVRWRRAIGAAKCISRMRNLPPSPDDDEDANFEFRFEETKTQIVDAEGHTKSVEVSVCELVDANSGKVKLLAASNWNIGKEKEERDELRGRPAGPGVSSLLYAVKQRPAINPKELAQLKREEEALKAEEQAALMLQQQQMMMIQMQQQQSITGQTYITAAQFKEREAMKRQQREMAEAEEARRQLDDERNFSYASKGNQGLSWGELDAGHGAAAKVGMALGMDDEDISPFDVAPEDPLRFSVWTMVRAKGFEYFILFFIAANCIQLALFDPKKDQETSVDKLFAPPLTPYKILEAVFLFVFPVETALKLYAYGRIYFRDFWNKVDFFCVVLSIVNLIPGLPNLTVIRTARMLKPLRSISRLPTLKVIVQTMVRSAQSIVDVYVICFFVYFVFAVLAMDLFGGALAQVCLAPEGYCLVDQPNPLRNSTLDALKPSAYETEAECPVGMWAVRMRRQPAELTAPLVDRRCGVYKCEEGYKCYLGELATYNPQGGNQSFDVVPFSLLTIFGIITRRGWVSVLHLLWDTYGYVFPTLMITVLQMFGSYLLTQMVTAAITITYEKVDDERLMEMAKARAVRRMVRGRVTTEQVDLSDDEPDGQDGSDQEDDPYKIKVPKPKKRVSFTAMFSRKKKEETKEEPGVPGMLGQPAMMHQSGQPGHQWGGVLVGPHPGGLASVAPAPTVGGAPGEAMTDAGTEVTAGPAAPPPPMPEPEAEPAPSAAPVPQEAGQAGVPQAAPGQAFEGGPVANPLGGGLLVSPGPPVNVRFDQSPPQSFNAQAPDQMGGSYSGGPPQDSYWPGQPPPPPPPAASPLSCKLPKCCAWRGLRLVRKYVIKNKWFDRFFYFAILVNMYALSHSDVQIGDCYYRYDASSDKDAYGVAFLETPPVVYADGNVTIDWMRPHVTKDGDCIRGAAVDTDDFFYYWGHEAPWYSINDVCSYAFALEALIMFLGYGWRHFDSAFNKFDSLVVLLCLVDVLIPLPAVSVMRFFRVANIVSKSTRLESLRRIVLAIGNSIGPLTGVVTLSMLFLFIFAVGGMQLYGLNLPQSDRLNFHDFSHACVTVFVMFTGDGWQDIMYKIMHEEGVPNAAFFVIFVIFGLFGLSMLILATLISKFDAGSKEDFSMSKVLPFHIIFDEIKSCLVALMKGSKRKRLRRERQLAELRRKGLLPEEEDEKKKEEEEEEAERERIEAEAEEEAAKKKKKKGKKGQEEEEEEEEGEKKLSPNEQIVHDAKIQYFFQPDHTVLQEHPSVVLRRCAEETRNQIEEDNRPEELNGPIGYGPLAIQPDGPLREQVLNKIIDRPWFENFIIACILVACAMLAYEGNGLEEDDPIAEYFLYVDLALLGVFVIECMLRILHKGLLFTNVAYLKDPWNQLDFFIVCADVAATVFSNIDFGGDLTQFRALRGFRALRPLRALKKAPELRAVVDVIANCLPVFVNLTIVSLVFYAVAGIFLMNLFSGRFWRCNDPTIDRAEKCGGYFAADTLAGWGRPPEERYMWSNEAISWTKQWPVTAYASDGTPLIARQWFNAPRNFDDAAGAMLTIFELSTLDHWVEVLFLVMDSPNQPGNAPTERGKNWPMVLVVFLVIIIGNFLLMNLLVCGVVVVYERLKTDSKHNEEMTRGQRELLDVIQLMIRTRPGKRYVMPDPLDAGPLRMTCWKIVMFDLAGDYRGTTFELVISLCVLLNTMVMAAYFFTGPKSGEFILVGSEEIEALQQTWWKEQLDLINDGFAALFFLEMCLKFIAFGARDYWEDNWNKFDLIVVWSGALNTAVEGFMGFEVIPTQYTTAISESMSFDPKTLRVLRVARLVRVIRLLKGLAKYERVQAITQLMDTLQNCIKHIINVFFLWLIVTVTFALMALSLFGTLPYGQGVNYVYGVYNEHTNFSSFTQAITALFKVATLDNWTWLMRDVMQGQRKYLGSFPYAWVFFVLYLIITAFLFLNIFTAIVMDQYAFTARVTSKPGTNGLPRQIMTFNQASTISEEWSYMDPKKTDFIDDFRIRKLLAKIGAPVGFREGADRAIQVRHLRRMELRMTNHSRQVHYVDFFISCAVMRYRTSRKPIADIDMTALRGKLTLEIEMKFPTINDERLLDSGGLLSAVQALEYLQSLYRGRIIKKMKAKGDWEGIKNYSENRIHQLEQQALKRQQEEEEANRKNSKSKGKDKKGKKDKKKKKKK